MKSFLLGKKNLSVEPLTPGAGPAPQGLACVPRESGGARRPSGPTVDVVKQGDKIMRLVVTCGCGERIEVECLYPAGA